MIHHEGPEETIVPLREREYGREQRNKEKRGAAAGLNRGQGNLLNLSSGNQF
jgi:hypothetical protein